MAIQNLDGPDWKIDSSSDTSFYKKVKMVGTQTQTNVINKLLKAKICRAVGKEDAFSSKYFTQKFNYRKL